MAGFRPALALDPLRFGKRPLVQQAPALPLSASTANADLRLFAYTFAAGFLFVSVFIA